MEIRQQPFQGSKHPITVYPPPKPVLEILGLWAAGPLLPSLRPCPCPAALTICAPAVGGLSRRLLSIRIIGSYIQKGPCSYVVYTWALRSKYMGTPLGPKSTLYNYMGPLEICCNGQPAFTTNPVLRAKFQIG